MEHNHENIVCGQGFNQKTSFQKNWDKDVFAVYKELNPSGTLPQKYPFLNIFLILFFY